MYLLLLAVGFTCAYIALFFLFPYFFEGRKVSPRSISLISIAVIVVINFLTPAITSFISDVQLRNRALHALGGGFLAFLLCFFAARDSRVKIRTFQFFVFSFLVVSTLGVINEIVEYVLQNYYGFRFTRMLNDTWLDLISNMVGTLIGGLLITPFFRSIHRDKETPRTHSLR